MKPKKAIIILLLIASAGALFIYLSLKKEPETIYTTVSAEIGNLTQTVSETGTVKAESELSLSFLNSGQLARLYVAIGDEVKPGDLLAELDYSGLEIRRLEAAAGLEAARSGLNKILSGAGEEEIAVARAGLDQARTAYESAKREMDRAVQASGEAVKQAEKTLSDLEDGSAVTPRERALMTARSNLANAKTAYQNAIDDAVKAALIAVNDKNALALTALDAITRVLTDDEMAKSFSREKPEYIGATTADHDAAKALAILADGSWRLANNGSTSAETLTALEGSYNYLNKTFSALNNCFNGLKNTGTSYNLPQTELDAFKSGISTQQSLIAAAIAAIQSRENALVTALLNYDTKISEFEEAYAAAQVNYEQALIDARNVLASAEIGGEQQITAAESRVSGAYEAWLLAQAQLDRVLAPANKYDVNLAQAQVSQAEAALRSTENQIENSKIFAPIAGVITALGYKPGEPAAAGGRTVVAMLGKSDYDIELLVSEADIAKLKAGDKAEITLDAYGDDIFFQGEVYFIEPAETEVRDVIYYKVKLSFDPLGYGIKSGMTANAVITTEQKKDVLLVPGRALIQKNGGERYVRILKDGQVEDRQVSTGIRGDQGMVEVLSGIKPGESVVTSIKTNN